MSTEFFDQDDMLPLQQVSVPFANSIYEALIAHAEENEISIQDTIQRAVRAFLRVNVDVISAGSFECHITFDVTARNSFAEREEIRTLVESYGMKFSCIDGDPLLGKKVFAYGTAYGESMTDLINLMHKVRNRAQELALSPVRMKVERIVYDTKRFTNPIGG